MITDNPSFSFQIIWQKVSEELTEEIVSVWKSLNVLPKNVNPRERAKEVVLLARNKENQIVGITTAKTLYYSPIKNELFFFRGLIVPGFRIPGLFMNMVTETIQVLEEHFNNSGSSPIGVFTEIENKRMQQANVTRLKSGMILIGFSERDNPIYVYYFKGSRY